MLDIHAPITAPERGDPENLVEFPLRLRRAWQRDPSRLSLQYQDAAGRVVPGQWHVDKAVTVDAFERIGRTSKRVLLARAESELVLLQPGGVDPKLPALETMLEASGAELITHRPGRRAVVRLRLSGETRFAKLLRPRKASRVVRATQFVTELDGREFDVATMLSADETDGMIVTREVEGRGLHELAEDRPNEFIRGCAAAGVALKSLHVSPPSWVRVHGADDEIELLRSRLEGIQQLLPEIGRAAESLTGGVCQALAEPTGDHRLLHRDFYDKQVVLANDGRVVLLDFDTLGSGEAALDLANMLAHLELRVLQGECRSETAREAANRFLESYAPCPAEAHRISAYLDATRLRLALLYALRPKWSHLTHVLLDSIQSPPVSNAAPCAPPTRPASSSTGRSRTGSAPRRPCPLMFVVGCPRSGTTMLERMLAAHPDIAMTHETHWITKHARRGRDLTQDGCLRPDTLDSLYRDHRFTRMAPAREEIERLTAKRPLKYRKFVRVVFDYYRRAQGKTFVGDKSTGSYVRRIRRLKKVCPDAKIVHLVRDGREVCLSMLNWPKAARAAGRFGMFSEDPVATTAAWWRWHVSEAMRQGRTLALDEYREVRYEQLVADPEGQCAALCEFLAVEPDPAMASFQTGKPRTAHGGSANASWLPPTPGLRDWRTQMSEDQIEIFEAIAGDTLSSLEYERRFPRVSARAAAYAAQCLTQWDRETHYEHTRTRPSVVSEMTRSPVSEG